MKQKIRDNGLSLAVFLIFVFVFLGQVLTGQHTYNDQQRDHHRPEVGFTRYLTTGHFVEATFENWESEFLQMGAYVVLTVCLVQKGSAESKDPDKDEEVDEDPNRAKKPDSPAPVWKGGLVEKLYENSLTIALFGLFLLSFVLHAWGGMREYNEEQIAHSGPTVGILGFFGTAEFWFQSFQNWQSEFFSIGVLVVLTIFLRQKGSPQSKPVAAPNSQTGEG